MRAAAVLLVTSVAACGASPTDEIGPGPGGKADGSGTVRERLHAMVTDHVALSYRDAEERFTKYDAKEKARLLRHRQDRVFATVCMFLDQKKRRCTVYEARPGVCREYPDSPRCGYYEFLKFERAHQDDPKFIALT